MTATDRPRGMHHLELGRLLGLRIALSIIKGEKSYKWFQIFEYQHVFPTKRFFLYSFLENIKQHNLYIFEDIYEDNHLICL